MINLIVFIVVFVLAWFLVSGFRAWSEKRSILDVPNERSSHETPTPVGGGVVIVVLTILSIVVWEMINGNGLRYWAFYSGGISIALISWFDDLKPIRAPARLAVHTIAAALLVWDIGYFGEIEVYRGFLVSLWPLGAALTIFWIVWLTNAYNFMDGIDGLAGIQAVIASGGWAIVGVIFNIELITFAGIVLMAASMGFLVLNWPPAKVFMGDVGSAFLGYTFAAIPILAIASAKDAGIKGYFPVIGLAFVWLFVADTLITFLRRLFTGDKVWSAHRKHLYQELVKRGFPHLRVTVIYGLLMILVSAVAIVGAFRDPYGLLYVSAAAAVLIPAFLVRRFRVTA